MDIPPAHPEVIKWIKRNKPKKTLILSNSEITELLYIPDNVERLDISNTAIKEINKLPISLKWLDCHSADIEKITVSFPKGIEFINVMNCDNLEPFEIPDGVIVKHDFKYYKTKKELQTTNHNEIAKKRIAEWNKTKNPQITLDLSFLDLDFLPEGIPDEVERLACNARYKSLKGLPKNLKWLSCSYYAGVEFDYLPEGLETLVCSDTKIKTISNLPNSLKKLKVHFSYYFYTVKSLPPNLKELELYHALRLREIMCELPKTLRILVLTETDISILPTLPESLRELELTMSTHIENIPNLPKNLRILDCMGIRKPKFLPPLPDNLLSLSVDNLKILDNNIIPNSIHHFLCDELQVNTNILRSRMRDI
jgi:hypothetical protein